MNKIPKKVNPKKVKVQSGGMIGYFHFLSKTYFKKIGPYITTLIGIGIFATMILLSIPSANDGNKTVLESISTFNKFFPFLFATLFSALSVNHIFKEGELDGSELIVVAKPLTRIQIIMTKFLMLLTVILLYQIVCLIAYFGIAYTDKVASTSVKLEWVGSLALGGFVVQIIAASVIVMISAALGKVGTTVVSILFAAIVPIASFTIVPLGGGWGNKVQPRETQTAFTLRYIDVNGKTVLAPDSSNMYKTIEGNETTFNEYKESQWYDKAAFGDVWYQWGRFYSMFTKGADDTTVIKNWDYEDVEIKANNSLTVTVAGKKHLIAFRGSEYISSDMVSEAVKNIINAVKTTSTAIGGGGTAPSIATINGKSFDERIAIYSSLLRPSPATPNLGTEEPQHIYAAVLAEEKLLKDGVVNSASQMSPAKTGSNIDMSISGVTEGSTHIIGDSVKLYEVGGKLKVLVAKDFIPTSGVIAGWSVIAVLLVLGSVIIYYRRDFK